jgi:hypothetical protein
MERSTRRSSAPGASRNETLAASSQVGSATAPAPLARPCGLPCPGYQGGGRSGSTHGRGHAPHAVRPAVASVRFPGRQARQARGAARWQDLELSPHGDAPGPISPVLDGAGARCRCCGRRRAARAGLGFDAHAIGRPRPSRPVGSAGPIPWQQGSGRMALDALDRGHGAPQVNGATLPSAKFRVLPSAKFRVRSDPRRTGLARAVAPTQPGPWVRRIARAIIERPSFKGDPAA